MTDLLKNCKKKFNDIILSLQNEIKKINVGQATPEFLDMVMVDAYDSGKMKINSLATVNVRDTSTLTLQVWDKSVTSKVVNAINDANLNVLVNKEADLIIVSLPAVTEEFRKVVVKKISEVVNRKKDTLKDARRDFRNDAEKTIKDSMGEDAYKRALKDIDKYKDESVKQIDNIFKAKKDEVMKL